MPPIGASHFWLTLFFLITLTMAANPFICGLSNEHELKSYIKEKRCNEFIGERRILLGEAAIEERQDGLSLLTPYEKLCKISGHKQ